jgi:predicted transcriptional regulator of viral defense system
MSRQAMSAVYSVAEGQHGYFAADQASSVGVSAIALSAMARRGIVERVSRGVYRISMYPHDRFGQYMEAVLWPQRGARGVLSHESALEFHGLSDVSPARVHITVPAGHRVRREVPPHLTLSVAHLAPSDVERLDGVPVTTPARTIEDCANAHLSPALIRQAIDDGRRIGKLGHRMADALAARFR